MPARSWAPNRSKRAAPSILSPAPLSSARKAPPAIHRRSAHRSAYLATSRRLAEPRHCPLWSVRPQARNWKPNVNAVKQYLAHPRRVLRLLSSSGVIPKRGTLYPTLLVTARNNNTARSFYPLQYNNCNDNGRVIEHMSKSLAMRMLPRGGPSEFHA
jgi:hypothetical protein